MCTVKMFEAEIINLQKQARKSNLQYIEINSGELHRKIGGYPGKNHRMPVCCDAMRKMMREGDEIITQPPKGNGASLTIKYKLDNR